MSWAIHGESVGALAPGREAVPEAMLAIVILAEALMRSLHGWSSAARAKRAFFDDPDGLRNDCTICCGV